MKNQKIASIMGSILLVSFTLAPVSTTLALENNATATANINKNRAEVSVKASSSDKIKVKDENRATTTGSITAAEHRSAVAIFVQNMLSIANREPGIGKEVRVIAQEQNNSSSTTAEAIAKVEKKSKISAFLFGTDYKNIGVIRSELAKTSKRVEKLNMLVASTTDVQAKTDLENQIKLLQDEQAKVVSFVNTHETNFSLFGWFTKIFSK